MNQGVYEIVHLDTGRQYIGSASTTFAKLNRQEKAITVPELCRLAGANPTTVKSRLQNGESISCVFRPPLPKGRKDRRSAA